MRQNRSPAFGTSGDVGRFQRQMRPPPVPFSFSMPFYLHSSHSARMLTQKISLGNIGKKKFVVK